MNQELLASGVACVGEVTGVIGNAEYANFMAQLIQSESMAKARGRGVWHGTEHVTTWNRFKNTVRPQK